MVRRRFLFWNAGSEKVVLRALFLFNIYHAAVMMDFRARRKEAASTGQMDEGIDWVAQVRWRFVSS